MPDTETKTKPRCPNCQSCEVIPLLGMLPGAPPYATEAGRLPVGQCVETDDAAPRDWRCEDCGHQWGEAGQASDRV